MEGTRADGVKIYCLCREPLGSGTMYGCDSCDGWFHERCISKFVGTSAHIDSFICPSCTVEHATPEDGPRRVTTYKRSCGNKGCRNACDVKGKRKFCSKGCAVKWAKGLLNRQQREERRRVKGMLEQCPEGMAQLTGAKPGAIPGIDVPFLGQTTVEESPYWKRLALRWDDDDVAEGLREEIKSTYYEDNAGYAHLHSQTVSKQQEIIRVVEAQREHTKYKETFLEAAIRFSKELVKTYKAEHGLEKVQPVKGKPTMHNPPNDVCGYDYRLHANDAWHAHFKASEEGQAVLAGTKELGLDTTEEIHTLGGVETVDPATIQGTICVKTKCRPHFDWAAMAAATNKGALVLFDDAIGDAEGLITKVDGILAFKMAVSKLRANWIKMQLKKLNREQLEYMKSIRGEQVNGDLTAVFKMNYNEVVKKMPAEIKEPVMEKQERQEKVEKQEDEEMKDESDDEASEPKERDAHSIALAEARNERRNAKRRETRKAQREKTQRLSLSASQTPSRDLDNDEDVEMADMEEQD